MVALIVAAHGAAAWGLLQVREVREAVALAAPMFVDLIAAPTPPPLSPPPPSPPPPKLPLRTLPPVPFIATPAAPTPAPPAFVVPEPPPELPPPAVLPATEPVPADTAAVAVAPPVPAAPPAAAAPKAVPAPPKLIPAASVQYLEPPEPEFPRASRRLGESGRVLLRVFIDEAGLPRQVLVAQSSGFARLDDAAVAAMKKARFRPYTENGQATAGWAPAPIDFELER